MRYFRLASSLLIAALLAAPARAEEAAPTLQLPPRAAPLSAVETAPLPVVRSQSQQAEDYAGGLIRGLTSAHNIPGLAFIAVEADRVMIRKVEGVTDAESQSPINIDSTVPVGAIRDVVVAIALIQQIERAKLQPSQDAGEILGDSALAGTSVAQILTHQVAESGALMRRLLEKISGQSADAYVQTEILARLGMRHSVYEAGKFSTSASDMGRLLLALLNQGRVDNEQILAPETVALMLRRHAGVHQALPGWTYGFAEQRRGGWTGLQNDGRELAGSATVEARLVLVHEASRGYFVAVTGRAGPEFWSVLDDSLFDQLMPARLTAELDLRTGAAPTVEDAERLSGLYAPAITLRRQAIFLKAISGAVRVQANAEGALVLSGATTASLVPRGGGSWGSDQTDLSAVLDSGRLYLGDGAYRRYSLLEEPALYAWLALTFCLAGTAAMVRPTAPLLARLKIRRGVDTGLGLIAAAFLLVLAAVVLERLALAG